VTSIHVIQNIDQSEAMIYEQMSPMKINILNPQGFFIEAN